MTDTLIQTVDHMLSKSWYRPTDVARTATVDLVVSVVQSGFAAPLSVHANMFKGTQCEWAGKNGFVLVIFDDNGRCFLVTTRWGEDGAEEIDLPTNAQIIEALRAL